MKRKGLYIVYSTLIILVALEISLRLLGYSPNVLLVPTELKNTPLLNKDSLQLLDVFYVNSEGVLKPNQHSVFTLDLVKPTYLSENKPIKRYYDYLFVQTNSEGFRGEEFVRDSTKDGILLIGDSFTWGFTADPLHNCFADILTKELPKNHIYNAGLPGVDLVTYDFLIRKYVPLLKPKTVIINFYLGNDIVLFDKKLVPNTNTDLFMAVGGAMLIPNYDSYRSDSIETFDTPTDAYQYIKGKLYLDSDSSNKFRRLCSKTVITTLGYRLFFGLPETKVHIHKHVKDVMINRKKILALEKFCAENHTRLILSIIPVGAQYNYVNSVDICDHIFGKDIPYVIPKDLNAEDYCKGTDIHFNNKGHKKYADFLIEQIKKQHTNK